MAVKYSTSPVNNTIKTNSIVLGNDTGDYGPTESTGFWSEIMPPIKGYVIYSVSEARPEPSIVVAHTDDEAIYIAKVHGGTNIVTIQDAISYLVTGSTGTTIVNMDFPHIVTNDSVVTLDTGFLPSYLKVGAIWRDLSGNNNHGTIGGASFNLKKGGIFDFDATDYVTITHNADLSLSTTTVKTIQIWIKFNDISDDTIIFNKVSDSYSYDGYSLRLATGGALKSITNGGGIANTITSLTGYVTTGIWYFITFQSVINNTAGSTKVFVNSTQVISTVHGTDTYSESNDLSIGSVAGASGVGGVNLNGNVSAFYFYDRQLSIQEIEQNYNATRSRFDGLTGLELTFDLLANASGMIGGNATLLADWNTAFGSPASPFTAISVVGDVVTLSGGSNITVPDGLFSTDWDDYGHLISIVDSGCIVAAGYNSFGDYGVDSYGNILEIALLPAMITAGEGCFYNGSGSGQLITGDFTALTTAGNGCFRSCSSLNQAFPALTTAGRFCFLNCTSLNQAFTALTTAGDQCFQSCTSLNQAFTALTTAGNYCFKSCTSLININLPSLTPANTSLGTTSGNNNVFNGITGKAVITLTVPTYFATNNAGGVDGDIAYLIANNTLVNITYV